MARIHLHDLPGDKRAGELAKLVESLYRARRRVVVWVEDDSRLKILDDYLWTYHKLAFLPHRVWTDGSVPDDEPIVLVSQPAEMVRYEVLVVGDGFPPADWAARFQEVHDLIPAGDSGTDRRGFWDRWREDHQSRENGE